MSEQEGRESEERGGSGRTEEAVSKVKDAAGEGGNGLASRVMRKEVLIPAAATVATAIAGVAARKGVGGKVKQFGGQTAEDVGRKTARGAKEELTGGNGGVGGLAAGAASK